jgi:hypothetical protein
LHNYSDGADPPPFQSKLWNAGREERTDRERTSDGDNREDDMCGGKRGNGGDYNVRESAHDTMRGETETRPGTLWKTTNDGTR